MLLKLIRKLFFGLIKPIIFYSTFFFKKTKNYINFIINRAKFWYKHRAVLKGWLLKPTYFYFGYEYGRYSIMLRWVARRNLKLKIVFMDWITNYVNFREMSKRSEWWSYFFFFRYEARPAFIYYRSRVKIHYLNTKKINRIDEITFIEIFVSALICLLLKTNYTLSFMFYIDLNWGLQNIIWYFYTVKPVEFYNIYINALCIFMDQDYLFRTYHDFFFNYCNGLTSYLFNFINLCSVSFKYGVFSLFLSLLFKIICGSVSKSSNLVNCIYQKKITTNMN